MKSSLLILVLFVGMPMALRAQAPAMDANFQGHLIGETIADFLRIEPEAQQEANVCRQRSERHRCIELIAALDRGQRAEVSTATAANYVLDAGKLVKLTMLVSESFEATSDALSKKFGALPKRTTLPSHNASGTKWDNQLYTWDTPIIYATLYLDNNPVLQDHRPLLIVESHAEHLIDNVDSPAKPTSVASSAAPKQ